MYILYSMYIVTSCFRVSGEVGALMSELTSLKTPRGGIKVERETTRNSAHLLIYVNLRQLAPAVSTTPEVPTAHPV